MHSQPTTRKDTRKLATTGQPGVYKRGTRYIVVWQHKGKQHKSYHRTLGEAKVAQGLRRQPGRSRPAARQAFPDYARDWLASYNGRTGRGLAKSTLAAYNRDLERWIIPFFIDSHLGEIEPPHVRAFRVQLENEPAALVTKRLVPDNTKKLAPASIKKILAPLKALLATAVEDGALQFNPAQGIRVKQSDGLPGKDKRDPIARAGMARILNALPDRERLLCLILAEAGVRISEALGLNWEDVQFGSKPQLHIRRQYYRGELKQLKTSKSHRSLPLTADLSQQLWTAKGSKQTGAIFCTRGGGRLSDHNVRRALTKACVTAGVDRVTCHTFRHTFASMLYHECKDISKVSGWLGHSDPAFTFRTYVHLLDDGLGEAPDWNVAKAA
jgi:integrase